MANWYYYDKNGQKQGLINDQQLQMLITQKIITPQTQLETESGQKGLAGQIPSLNFLSSAPSLLQLPYPQPVPTMSPHTPSQSKDYVQYQYKCASAPKVIHVAQWNEQEQLKAVAGFADIINQNCTDGWEYYGMEELVVQELPGCLFALAQLIPALDAFLSKPVVHNMLVFRKPI